MNVLNSDWDLSFYDEYPPEDHALMMWYYGEFLLDEYIPTHGGGTRPKPWWKVTEKGSEITIQRRELDSGPRQTWKHGRDLPARWTGRNCGKHRQLKKALFETEAEFFIRQTENQRSVQHTNRRKARQSIRTMKMATLTEPFDASQFISAHANF